VVKAGPNAWRNWVSFDISCYSDPFERLGGKTVGGTEPLGCKRHSESILFFLHGCSLIYQKQSHIENA
jgi:hypothetical protein